MMTYTEEQLNYFRMVHIVMNIFSSALRSLFKSEWKSAYGTPWCDTKADGRWFYRQESLRNQQNNKVELAVIAVGDSSKFDDTTLFYCLLYSDSLGSQIQHRKRHVYREVNNLRMLRNEVCHIAPSGEASRAKFTNFCQDALSAVTKLHLPTNDLQKVMKETSFETKELQKLQSRLLETQQRLEEYEEYLSSKVEKAKCFERKFSVEKHYRSMQRNGILTRKDVEALKKQKNKGLRSVQLIDTVVYKGSSTVCNFLQYIDKHEPACRELFIEAATIDTDVLSSQTGQVQVVSSSERSYPESFHDVMQIMTTDVYQKKWVEMECHADFYLHHSSGPAVQFLIQIELAYGLGVKGERERGEKILDGTMSNMWQAGSDYQWLMPRALARKSLLYNYRKDYAGSQALAEQGLSMITTVDSPEEHILCSKRIADCVLYSSGTIEEKRELIVPLWDCIWELCQRNIDTIPRSKFYMRFVLADRARLELGFSKIGFQHVPSSNLAQAEKCVDQLQQPDLKTATEDTYTDAFRLICKAVIAFQRKQKNEAKKHSEQVSAISKTTTNEGIMLMIKHMQSFMEGEPINS